MDQFILTTKKSNLKFHKFRDPKESKRKEKLHRNIQQLKIQTKNGSASEEFNFFNNKF